MIDRELLRRTMQYRGVTNEKMAEALGRSRDTLQRKLRGEVKFYLDEVIKIKEIVSLSDAEVIQIFFK